MELQFITHFTDRYSYYDSARLALEGGCRWIQLRMKDASPEEREQEAVRIQELCRTYEATFIIDDDVELVKKLKADGVHLGKNDMPIAEARHIFPLPCRSRLHRLWSLPLHDHQEEPESHPGSGRLPFHRPSDA